MVGAFNLRDKSPFTEVWLTESKRPHAMAWMANYKRLIKLVYRLSEVNFRLLRYHYDKLERQT